MNIDTKRCDWFSDHLRTVTVPCAIIIICYQIERELEIQRKQEAKRDTRDKLLTMFSHALANRAATQRYINAFSKQQS